MVQGDRGHRVNKILIKSRPAKGSEREITIGRKTMTPRANLLFFHFPASLNPRMAASCSCLLCTVSCVYRKDVFMMGLLVGSSLLYTLVSRRNPIRNTQTHRACFHEGITNPSRTQNRYTTHKNDMFCGLPERSFVPSRKL